MKKESSVSLMFQDSFCPFTYFRHSENQSSVAWEGWLGWVGKGGVGREGGRVNGEDLSFLSHTCFTLVLFPLYASCSTKFFLYLPCL